MGLATNASCANCGSLQRAAQDRFCAFCGTEYPRERTEREVRHDQLAGRFEALRRHPRLAELMRRSPSSHGAVLAGVGQAVFLVFFGCVALAIAGIWSIVARGHESMGDPFGEGPWLSFMPLIPVGMAVLGFVLAARSMTRTARVAGSDLVRAPACVLALRDELRVQGSNSRSIVRYAALRYDDGKRAEFELTSGLAARLIADDLGVAYVRGGMLIDFVPLEV